MIYLTTRDVASTWLSLPECQTYLDERYGIGAYPSSMLRQEVDRGRLRASVSTVGKRRLRIRVHAVDLEAFAVAFEAEMAMRPPFKPLVQGVYFISCEQFVKIGQAACVKSRLKALRGGVPYELSCLAVIPCTAGTLDTVEREHHERFKAFRVRWEWFRHEGALADYIRALPPVAL